MARRGGYRRKGRKGRFRYVDSRGNEVTKPSTIDRIEALAIPPAWKDVWISPRANANLQATGLDSAGRRQYLYHPDYRARQEQAKYDKLVRFAEKLPQLRAVMSEHMDCDDLSCERVSAIAVRLINLGWFRVGSDRYAKRSRTYGITTLRKRHVKVRGSKITFRFRGKGRAQVHTAIVDEELAKAVRELLKLDGGSRVFRYERDGELYDLTSRKLNEYIQEHMGEEFTAKDFRTWGGTLTAALELAEHELPETESAQRRLLNNVMRTVGKRLGNTPAVARSSYVGPAVVEQYLDGRTIEDFRPKNLRVVRGRQAELEIEEKALLSLLRSWRIRSSRKAA